MDYRETIKFLQQNYLPLDYVECQHRPEFKNNTGIVVRLLYDAIRHQLEEHGTVLRSDEVLQLNMNVCEHSGLHSFLLTIRSRTFANEES